MQAEILSIGTEILLGSILNTNAQYLSKKLSENAFDVYHQVSVGDNVERIAECFGRALSRSDLAISSGGLGPTEDDATLRGLALFLGRPLLLHHPTYRAVQSKLKKRRLRMTRLIAKQCYLPKNPKAVFQNIHGTAPGVLYEAQIGLQKKWVLLLPGPPRELEPLFSSRALPALLRFLKPPKEVFLTRSLRIADVPESQVAQKITDLLKWPPPLTVGIYAKPGQVELKIMAKDKNREKARRMIGFAETTLRKRLGKIIYGIDEESLSFALGSLLKNKKQTLSVAESCTGGLLGHLLTETPGSSDYFKGGLTAYHNSAKKKLLGVDPEILRNHGAVSEQVAKQMALRIRAQFETTFGIGITGIAGPKGGSRHKPVGLVYIAFSGPKKTTCEKYIFFGSRSQIKARAADKALNRLRLKLR